MRCPISLRFLFLSLFLISGCQSREVQVSNSANSQFHTDDLGRKVSVAKSPSRIISLAPNITETLFALGLNERVIGVTTYCDFPAEAKSKEKIGDTIKPNLERIIALKPDLVLLSTSSQLEKITHQLDQLAIPVYITNPRTVTEVIASIRKLGEVTGTSLRAEELATSMQQRINSIKPTSQRPRVLYVLQLSPLITAGKNTFINDLINLAGGISISGEETTDYPQFSRETVIARAPEIIILPESHGSEIVDLEAVKKTFVTTPAVKNNRIVTINPDLIDRPGPRIVEGLAELEKKIHGK
jgi:iron complex transport system substrate-binding protein